MFCGNCGTNVPEGYAFCPNCGAKMITKAAEAPKAEPQPVYAQPYEAYSQPAAQAYPAPQPEVTPAEAAPGANGVLTSGIVALCFSCSFFLSFVGIILSAVAMGKAKRYVAQYGPVSKKVRIGKILSTVGLFVGIAMTILFVLYLALIVLAVARGGSYSWQTW